MSWTAEVITYTIIWTSAVLYGIYSFTVQTNKLFSYVDASEDLKDGWSYLKRSKDVADSEWEIFLYFCQRIYRWIILQIIITKLLVYKNHKKAAVYCRILISCIFIIFEVGVVPFLMISVFPFVFLLADVSGSYVVLWIINLCSIAWLNLFKHVFNLPFLSSANITLEQMHFIITTTGWMTLKCISYYTDLLNKKSKNPNKDNEFLYFLDYCFYLPTLIFGPFILFDDFKLRYEKQSRSEEAKIKTFLFDLGRFVFWMMFLEFWLHFIYVNVVSYYPEVALALDDWAFYGYGYIMGQAFHIKYLVMYGLSTSIAKYEGMNVPTLPKCIGRIHLYSDMWKYFDAGLYKFLVRYIYIPTLKTKKAGNKLLSSFLCFMFIYIWHGLEMYILIWAVLNFIGVSVESLSTYAYDKYLRKKRFISSLSENSLRRLTCLLATPLVVMSAISNFYFFAGKHIGDIFVMRLFHGELLNLVILFLIMHTLCQVSTELRTKTLKVYKIKKK